QCDAANRINSYAFRRVLKQRVLDKTGLLYTTVPDLVMLAKSSAKASRTGPHDVSMIETLEKTAMASMEKRGGDTESCHASVLMGYKLRNKSIIKFRTPSRTVAICKVANVHLPRAEAVERAYRL